jgi:hypothetical protein
MASTSPYFSRRAVSTDLPTRICRAASQSGGSAAECDGSQIVDHYRALLAISPHADGVLVMHHSRRTATHAARAASARALRLYHLPSIQKRLWLGRPVRSSTQRLGIVPDRNRGAHSPPCRIKAPFQTIYRTISSRPFRQALDVLGDCGIGFPSFVFRQVIP